eukprot:3940745-Rhodomonas_salina.14
MQVKPLSCYAIATRCPVLTSAMLLPGNVVVGFTGSFEVRGSGRLLRAPYAMPGTDIAYGALSLRTCYAIPGTDVAYGAVFLRDAWY